MNQQERARILASLIDDEVEQLGDRAAGAAPSEVPSDAELRTFARQVFGGGDD
jgi:hypothetical protein